MQEIHLEELIVLCNQNKIVWTEHVLLRLKQRNIKRADVKHCISNGEIIEQYPCDKPCPSCLVLGLSLNKRYLHVVCAIKEGLVCMISAYYPDTIKWECDYKTRKAVE